MEIMPWVPGEMFSLTYSSTATEAFLIDIICKDFAVLKNIED